jgi:hypothetical protein
MPIFRVKYHFTTDWVCTTESHKNKSFAQVVGFYTANSDNYKSVVEVEILAENAGYEVFIAISIE